MTGRIHSYESFGAVDGPGIRFVVFFQGCPLRCVFCHNPDTWDPSDGTEVTVDEVVDKVRDYKPFYRNGGGVTLSGGEPLLQHEFVLALIHALHAEGIHVAIDTSGGIPLSVCKDAVDAADMLLLDIKAYDRALCAEITGSDAVFEREKELLEYCESVGKPVWIRHVVVPGYTLDKEKLEALAEYLRGFKCVERIEPLPFHKMGEHKWEPGLYRLADTQPPTEADMEMVNAVLKAGR